MNGKNINMFLMDGDVTSSIKCTLSNWTGVIYKIPREKLSSEAIRTRQHLKHSGIYFLIGQDKGEPVVYVGQAGNRKNGQALLLRVLEHTKNPDMNFFSEVIILTTDNNIFGPTELIYLENQFTQKIRAAGRYKNVNPLEPNIGNVTEEKESELLEVLANSEMIIGTLGHKLFIPVTAQPVIVEEPGLMLYLERKMSNSGLTIKATCIKDARGFTVLPGSMVNSVSAPHDMESFRILRQELRTNDGIVDNILQVEQTFSSPSGAAVFVIGGRASGNESWRTADGIALGKL